MNLKISGERNINLVGRKHLNHTSVDPIKFIKKTSKTRLIGAVVEYIVIAKYRNCQQSSGPEGPLRFPINEVFDQQRHEGKLLLSAVIGYSHNDTGAPNLINNLPQPQ